MNELTATQRTFVQPPASRGVESRTRAASASQQAGEAQGGKPVPPAGKPAPQEPPEIETRAAVEQLNQYLKDSHRSLVFEMSEDLGRTIIKVVNPVTQEVIREIPPDSARVMAASLQSGRFSLLNLLA